MGAPVAVIQEYTGERPGREVCTFCPGCGCLHPFTIEAPAGPNGQRLNRGTTWDWDGNLEQPTFSPSLLVYNSVHLCQHTYWVCLAENGECGERSHTVGYRLPDGTAIAPKTWEPVPAGATKALLHESPHEDPTWGQCHSFLRGGVWEFLSDSAHHLAGQSVPMVPLPHGWR